MDNSRDSRTKQRDDWVKWLNLWCRQHPYTWRGCYVASGVFVIVVFFAICSLATGSIDIGPVYIELGFELGLDFMHIGSVVLLLSYLLVVFLVMRYIGHATRDRYIREGRCEWCGYPRIDAVDRASMCSECGRSHAARDQATNAEAPAER